VWIAYDLPGSYEELPPNLLDELKRDRRWCQGNLMNFRLFLVRGMHPVHRAVFLTGVMSYLSAPLWFMFLALSTALQVVHALTEPQYFLQPRQLFPVWPQWRPELAIALFASTMVLLFLPKLLSIILVWCKGPKEYGGFIRVTLSCCWRSCSRSCWRRFACCSTPSSWSAPSSAGKWCGIRRSVMMTPRRGEKPLCVTARSCCWGWYGRSEWHGWICASCSGWRRSSSR
jgi:membrane glycosyltransferase